MVEVKIYSEKLKVYYQDKELCIHERSYGLHQWRINLGHYLTTLRIKPGALHGSTALTQAPEVIRGIYQDYFRSAPRDFIELLQYCYKYQVSNEKLLQTIEQVKKLCPNDIRTEKVMAMLGNQPYTSQEPSAENTIHLYAQEQLAEVCSLVKKRN
jgi:hypothetical protein